MQIVKSSILFINCIVPSIAEEELFKSNEAYNIGD